jgi:hypothetical protein
MTVACLTFDTLIFARRLEAAGMDPKIAEAQAELQAEVQAQAYERQAQALEKFAEYQPLLDEIKITRGEFATKGDIRELRIELQSEIRSLRHELLIKLGGIAIGCTALFGTLVTVLAIFIGHGH